MKAMGKPKKNRRITNTVKITILFSIVFLGFIGILFQNARDPYILTAGKNDTQKLNGNNVDTFNVLDFWKTEINRVNAVDLNVQYGNTSTYSFRNDYSGESHEVIKKEISFQTPNWVGQAKSILTMKGYLLFPVNYEKAPSSNGGCLLMHGLNGNVEQSVSWANPYLEKGLITIVYSHPGHGNSEGARPSPDNFYFKEDFNRSSHFYLTMCAAIQALRVLESIPETDNSKIIVAGGSYGALNTIFLSGIVGKPRIAGAIPCGALGDLDVLMQDPTKLLFYVFDELPDNLKENNFLQNQALRIDPKYYLESEHLPPILFQIGTNDEFFHYRQINGTLDAIPNEEKFVQIYANAHHGFPDYQNASKFFVDYILNQGPEPPRITSKSNQKLSSLLGDDILVNVQINSELNIKRVRVCYRYIDIVGSSWNYLNMDETEAGSWSVTLNPSVLNSRLDYYIVIELEGESNIWFTSQIYTKSMMNTPLSFVFITALLTFAIIPYALIIWRRYEKSIKHLAPEIKMEAKKYFIIEISLITCFEVLFFVSLLLPWIILESGPIVWTHLYIFNNIFTWQEYFGIVAIYLTIGFIIGWILYSHLSLVKPITSGIIKLGYPILVSFVFAWYLNRLASPSTSSSAQIFGAGYPGVGLYLMFICSIAPIIIGIWKHHYRKKLGVIKA